MRSETDLQVSSVSAAICDVHPLGLQNAHKRDQLDPDSGRNWAAPKGPIGFSEEPGQFHQSSCSLKKRSIRSSW
jgi:hypothetical protein